jgi:hypothetical protein
MLRNVSTGSHWMGHVCLLGRVHYTGGSDENINKALHALGEKVQVLQLLLTTSKILGSPHGI